MSPFSVAIIVAHPDDETLWVGGTILNNPSWQCFIVSLCRQTDIERASKFNKVLKILNAQGNIGNLDDGPNQQPLDVDEVTQTILDLLPKTHYDLIITHQPKGEYTRHLRHEEVSKAVMQLLETGKIITNQLWMFAYEDGHKAYLPKAIENAPFQDTLTDQVWLKKYSLITDTYGFAADSWEAQTTPKTEAFWQFDQVTNAITQFSGKSIFLYQ